MLDSCLGFLTGDRWSTSFDEQTGRVYVRPPRSRARVRRFPADAVCLFSGGLDSLIGAVNWLEEQPQGKLLLMGHYDTAGPASQQKRLHKLLDDAYPSRTALAQLRVGHSGPSAEPSSRSRSFLFVGAGIAAAMTLGDTIPVLMPENGVIAINVPLTPSRRGTCSTRTAHPRFLRELQCFLSQVGLNTPVVNPLGMQTKGECVSGCRNPDLLAKAAVHSVSCAKGGHKEQWIRKGASNCGCCVPCIYRRASLHAAGLDQGIDYGVDPLAGEVDLTEDPRQVKEQLADLRAVLSFLRLSPDGTEIRRRLIASGYLDPAQLPLYAELVMRGMDEVRALLQDKGTADLRQRAGL